MRTTLQIDDDLLEAARSIAKAEARSLGEVISRLVRKGLAPAPQEADDEGFPVFELTQDIAPLTTEMVRLADEGE